MFQILPKKIKCQIKPLFEVFSSPKLKNQKGEEWLRREAHRSPSHTQLREQWTRKDPRGKRGARLPAVEVPVGFCRTEEVHYEGREKGLGQAGKNLGEMYHGAITLTDRHPLLISMHKKKKDQWIFEGRKRQPFIFLFGCSWSGDSTSFWVERTMKRATHLHKNTCLYSTAGKGGGRVFNSAMAFIVWNNFCAWPGEN